MDKNWNRDECEMSQREFIEASQTMYDLMSKDDPDAFQLDSDWPVSIQLVLQMMQEHPAIGRIGKVGILLIWSKQSKQRKNNTED